jgi:hypothetical protein
MRISDCGMRIKRQIGLGEKQTGSGEKQIGFDGRRPVFQSAFRNPKSAILL